MRNYIRHPISIPIQVSATGQQSSSVNVSNLSAGGLCFLTDLPVKVGEVVDLSISCIKPDYQGEGVIVWRRGSRPFEVGVRFANDDEYFRMRMVEQVCQIETYREQLRATGRELSREDAAMEWIEQYAANFDQKSHS